MVAAPQHREIAIRGGIRREFFEKFIEGRRREKAVERELGRPLNYRDEDEYEIAADCYKFPRHKIRIVVDDEEEEIETPRPYLVEGRVGTGKTFGIAMLLHCVAEQFAGIRILVIRQTFESLTDSFKATFEDDVLSPDHYFLNENKRERPQRKEYVYPNGSRIVMRGFDKPGRTLSTEWDIIYFMEVTDEGIDYENVQKLARSLRGNRVPVKLFIMDCNPAGELHWANQLALKGKFTRVVTQWEDNPAFFSAKKKSYTRKGKDYISQIKGIYVGVNYDRYVRGLWRTAEGAIFSEFEMGRNVVDFLLEKNRTTWQIRIPESPYYVTDPVRVEFFLASMDFGMDKPASVCVWAVDGDRRLYLVEEYYLRQKNIEWWSGEIVRLDKKYKFEAIICDSADPDNISVLRARMLLHDPEARDVVVGVKKSGEKGMGFWRASVALTNALFAPEQPNEAYEVSALPRIILRANTLAHPPDVTLPDGHAHCALDEISNYVYRKAEPGKAVREEAAPTCADHACDAIRYVVWWLHRMFATPRRRGEMAPPPHRSQPYGYGDLEFS